MIWKEQEVDRDYRGRGHIGGWGTPGLYSHYTSHEIDPRNNTHDTKLAQLVTQTKSYSWQDLFQGRCIFFRVGCPIYVYMIKCRSHSYLKNFVNLLKVNPFPGVCNGNTALQSPCNLVINSIKLYS